jgi:hypothetical protein
MVAGWRVQGELLPLTYQTDNSDPIERRVRVAMGFAWGAPGWEKAQIDALRAADGNRAFVALLISKWMWFVAENLISLHREKPGSGLFKLIDNSVCHAYSLVNDNVPICEMFLLQGCARLLSVSGHLEAAMACYCRAIHLARGDPSLEVHEIQFALDFRVVQLAFVKRWGSGRSHLLPTETNKKLQQVADYIMAKFPFDAQHYTTCHHASMTHLTLQTAQRLEKISLSHPSRYLIPQVSALASALVALDQNDRRRFEDILRGHHFVALRMKLVDLRKTQNFSKA